jgi:signal peptidase I
MEADAGRSQPIWWRRVLIGRKPKRTLVRIVVLVLVVFTIFPQMLLPIHVQGASMLPTYRENGVNLVNRLAYRRSDPKRGDVVAIRLASPSVPRPSIMYMKRIVGLPGETIAFVDGRVVVNGTVLHEPYVKFPSNWQSPPRKLDSDEYYVVGDNRSMSSEEHSHGAARRHKIVGKILL